MRLAEEEVGIGMCAALGLGLGLGLVLGLIRRMRSRMEKKRLRARSQMVRRCRQRRRKSVPIILSIRNTVGGASALEPPFRVGVGTGMCALCDTHAWGQEVG
jgi:hypothetical protein